MLLHKALQVTSQITREEESKHSMAVAVSAPGVKAPGRMHHWPGLQSQLQDGRRQAPDHLHMKKHSSRVVLKAEN